MKCPYCAYEWTSRKPNPVSCPKCKRRLDQIPKRLAADPLLKAKVIERGFQRTTYVMSLLTLKMEAVGIFPVIVGGAAVEFYTKDWYSTGDIDLAINEEKRGSLDTVFKGSGFTRSGRCWVREDLALYIEAPGDVRDISKDRITKVETETGHVYFIGIDDILFDRIQAAKHWKSESDKEQAIRMAFMFFDQVNWQYLSKRCQEENSMDMLKMVKEAASDANDKAR